MSDTETLSRHFTAFTNRQKSEWEAELVKLKNRRDNANRQLQSIEKRIARLEGWIGLVENDSVEISVRTGR